MKKAIILCAGLGTRLRPLTNSIPKALVDIGGKPLLWYNLKLIEKYGIKSVGVNLFHLHEKVISYLEKSTFGVVVTTKVEKEILGTAGGV